MDEPTTVIDAAVRFLRTNPRLIAYAQAEAARNGLSVDRLLADTVARVRALDSASALKLIAEEQVVRRTPHRQQRRSG